MKLLYTFGLFVCLNLAAIKSYSQLTKLNVGVNKTLNSVEFIDDNIGFVGGIGVVGKTTLLRTTDGGTTWNDANINTVNDIEQISFLDDSIGAVTTAVGELFTSRNAGVTWQNTSATLGANRVVLHTEKIWLAYNSNVSQTLKRTTDGGVRWNSVIGLLGIITSMYFHDSSSAIGFAGTSDGNFYKSIDHGRTWNKLNQPINSAIETIFFINEAHGFLSGKRTSGQFTVETLDSGKTWTSTVADTGNAVIHHIDNGGTGFSVSKFGLYMSYDYWRTRIEIPGREDVGGANRFLLDLDFPSNNVGYACGFEGLLYKIDTRALGVRKQSNEKKEFKVYPNPSSGVVKIEIPENVIIEKFLIRSFDGSYCAECDVKIPQTQINLSGLPGGMYFLSFKTENDEFTSTLLLKD